MLTSKSAAGSGTGTNTGGGTGTGNGTGSGNSPGCSATESEFPLAVGAGYATSSNSICEQKYVTNIQKALNQFISTARQTPLTVDGKFGPKTEAALQAYFKVTAVNYDTYNVLLPYAK